MYPIYKFLKTNNFISDENIEQYSNYCRDKKIKVYKDKKTDIIYLDPNYIFDTEEYYKEKEVKVNIKIRNDMDWADTKRRAQYISPLIAGNRWLDFGAGPGYLLLDVSKLANEHMGLEINKHDINLLKEAGINVSNDIHSVKKFKPNVITLFHVLEHLPDPVKILSQLLMYSEKGAKLIIEVPHSKDFLLYNENEKFKQNTLWSEHLVLHTRASLRCVVEGSGWMVKEILGIQRYPISNHFEWFKNGKPSGLKNSLVDSASLQLNLAYEQYLANRDLTDTLLIYAEKK